METLTKNIPHVRQIGIKKDALVQLICNRIGWTEQQYLDYQFHQGLEFIDDMISNLIAEDKKLITYSAMFWGWWANKWFSRDAEIYNQTALDADDYCGIHEYYLRSCEITAKGFYSNLESFIDDGAESIKAELEGAKI